MVAMTDPAKKGPQAVVWLPMKSASPICTVNFDGSLSIVSATGNSSKAALKVNMDTSATAGSDSGMIRRPITRIVLAPSSRNASSYSRGIPAKKPRKKKIIKGRFELTYSSTSPSSESIRWSRSMSRYCGIRSSMFGIAKLERKI